MDFSTNIATEPELRISDGTNPDLESQEHFRQMAGLAYEETLRQEIPNVHKRSNRNPKHISLM